MPKRESRARLRRVPPAILARSRELRHPLTPAEAHLWRYLRAHQLGVHIRRQHVLLGRFIADFYCATSRLCIEVDGDTHAEPNQAEYDAERTSWLEEHGYHVLRVANADVLNNTRGCARGDRRGLHGLRVKGDGR